MYINLLDSPGHSEFVSNMITGASQADYAILVIDVPSFENGFSNGGLTKEHSYLIKSLGARDVIVALNKMDLVNWDSKRYHTIKNTMNDFLTKIGFKEVSFLPISAFFGENLNSPTNRW